MEFFDTHAHYYADAFDADREEFVAALPEHGVTKVVCPGCALESSRKSRDLAEQFPFFYFAAGVHPEDIEGVDFDALDEVEALCRHPKCVAVGEIGLDYYWVKGKPERERSREFYRRQLALAESWASPPLSTTGTPTGTPWTSPWSSPT